MLLSAELKYVSRDFYFFFTKGITVPSFIIVGYA